MMKDPSHMDGYYIPGTRNALDGAATFSRILIAN
jgi:hypothetical protein